MSFFVHHAATFASFINQPSTHHKHHNKSGWLGFAERASYAIEGFSDPCIFYPLHELDKGFVIERRALSFGWPKEKVAFLAELNGVKR